MKYHHRLISLLAVIGLLFGVASLGTSCMSDPYVTSPPQTSKPITTSYVTVSIEDTVEETTSAAEVTVTIPEPEPLPGNDTLDLGCQHRYGDWVVAIQPQCEEAGLQYRLCADCEGRQEEPIDATGHTEEPIADVPSTCTVQGSEGGTYCTVCKETVKEPMPAPLAEHTFRGGEICTTCGTQKDGAGGLAYLDLYNQRYGYDYLGTMANGGNRQRLYSAMDEVIRQFHTDSTMDGKKDLTDYPPVVCKINFADLGLVVEDAYAIWKTYKDDNPLYYWLSNTVVSDLKNIYVLMDPDYTIGTVRAETNSALYQNISDYLAILPANATDYQIALLIHDKMIAFPERKILARGIHHGLPQGVRLIFAVHAFQTHQNKLTEYRGV